LLPTAPQDDDELLGAGVALRHIPNRVAKELVNDATVTDGSIPLEFLELVRGLQAQDPSLSMEGTAVATGTRAGYYRTDGLLYFKDRLIIPGSLRRELLRRHYDDPRVGHGSLARILDLLSRFYYWEGIADDVKDYVSKCSVCQGNRVPRHKPYGKLKSLPLPTRP